MKKILRLSAVLLLIGIIFSAFASCGKVTGNRAIKKLEKLMEASDNFYSENRQTEMTGSMTLSGTLSDMAFSSTTDISGSETLIGNGTADISYYETATYKTTSKIAEQTESVDEFTIQEGYIDNSMIYSYIPAVQSKESRRVLLKSDCDYNDFKEYLEIKDREAGLGIEPEHIEEITFEKDSKRKNWEITISELTKSGEDVIEEWINRYAADTGMIFKLKSIEITMISDSKLNALTSLEVRAKATSSSDSGDLELVIKSTEEYSLPDSDAISAPTNIDEYKKIGDLRYRFFVTNEMQKLKALKDVEFIFSTQTTASMFPSTASSSENDTVTIANKDGKFLYHIDSYVESNKKGYNVIISYDGQTQKTKINGSESQSVDLSENEAKSYLITNMLSIFSFEDNNIKNLQVVDVDDTTVVAFTLDNYDKLTQIFNSIGIYGNYSKRNVAINFTLNKETHELISVEYTASGSANSTEITLKARISNFREPNLSLFEDQ